MARSFVLLVTVSVLAWMPVPVAHGQVRDLIENGGFEDGLNGWIPSPQHVLVTNRRQAYKGDACLSGEVTRANQHLSIRRRVPVKAGNRYEFQIAARATNRTKLVLFVHDPQRRSVAAFDKLTPNWRVYRTPISVRNDGELELEIIAPSSHGAPPGKIWIDDVALLETEMPTLLSASEDEGFNDEPAMAAAADGSVYVAWNSFQDLTDTLQVARYQQKGEQWVKAGQWELAGGPDQYVMALQVVPAGDKVYVLYGQERKRQWDVFAAACSPQGPGPAHRLSQHAAVDVNPAGAWHAGTLWVAWESNRTGGRGIYLTTLGDDGKAGEAQALSDSDCSSYQPSVAVRGDGRVFVAWHSFRDNNYDIYVRRAGGGKSLGPVQRLTTAPGVDRHARLVAHGNEILMAYENAVVEDYYVGRTNFRRIMIARVTDDGLQGLPDYRQSPLYGRCEGASLAVDPSGRLWVAFLKPRLPRTGWDPFLTCYDGSQWLTPRPLSPQKGMDRRPQLVRVGNQWLVGFQADDLPRSWSDVDLTPAAKSNIMIAVVDGASLGAATNVSWQALVEPDEPFDAGRLRLERGEDQTTPEVTYRGQTFKLFYGDLHQHSDVSVCNRLGDQAIEEDYQFSRDINRLDFACSTDHGYNINPYLWAFTAKQARVQEDPGRYLTFLAEEWTSTFEEYSAEHPYGFYGHRNLIFGDTYFPRWWNARNRQTPAEVWEDLRKLNADFVHIPHQLADTGNVPTDWNYTDETAQPVAEIFQVRGSYEYKGTPREAVRTTPPGYFIQDAWARGIVIGVIAAPDHGGGYGKACVYAPELSRKEILAGLRARRCFGTTGARIFLDVRVNDHFMGEKVAEIPKDSVKVDIAVRCPMKIATVEVCRNNEFVYTNQPDGKEARLSFVDMDPPASRSYYYVRVIQEDEEIAWSSPVWFGAP